jgi:NAD(P)-dependent dehydrogenase (short-subunit alcohol dehydrogenase family)
MTTDTTPGAKPKAAETARKRALVTGASSGLGEEFARQLAERGYDLVIVARRKDRLEKLAAELGGNVEVLEADLTQPGGVEAVTSRLARGDIDMLVNNAGFGTNGVFADLPVERELEEIDLNVRAHTAEPRRARPDAGEARRRDHQRRLDRFVPACAIHGDLRGDQGLRPLFERGSARRSEVLRRHRDLPLPGADPNRVP